MDNTAEMIEEDILDIDETELDISEEPEEELELDSEEPEGEVEEESEEEVEEEVVVQIGEESPPQEEEDVAKAPEWVRELRKAHRDQQRENRKLKEQLEQMSGTGTKTVELGSKPTLEDADYDAEAYERKLAAWYEQKREYEDQQRKVEEEKRKQTEAWKSTLDTYAQKRQELKVKDYEDAEMIVQDELSNTQQGMILQGADNPALLVYALGKNPSKAKELASIQDPVKFAFAVAKLETQLKVTNRKASTKPESQIVGKAPKSGTVDSNLERLRAEAERTGDYTKVVAYKKNKRAAK
jgi:hypothetical protein